MATLLGSFEIFEFFWDRYDDDNDDDDDNDSTHVLEYEVDCCSRNMVGTQGLTRCSPVWRLGHAQSLYVCSLSKNSAKTVGVHQNKQTNED